MTDQSSPKDSEITGSFFSGWRKALLWTIGAAALGFVGYRGALGTEIATAATPSAATAAPATSASAAVAEAARAPTSAPRSSTPDSAHDDPRGPDGGARAAENGELGDARGTASSDAGTPPPAPIAAPAAGSAAPTGAGAEHAAAGTAPSAVTPDGRVILNLASEAELQKLPGIGRSRARAIVQQRERMGRFRRLEDLLRVKGIGRKRLAALRSRLVLDAPEGAGLPGNTGGK